MTESVRSPRHRRRNILAVIVVLLLAAVIGFILWLNRDVTPVAPILTTDTPLPVAQTYAASAAESILKITIDSRLGNIEGNYKMGPGTIEFHQEGTGWRLIANLTFDGRTLDIGNDAMNTAMRSALEVEKYPSVIYIGQSSTLLPDLTGAQQVEIVGRLEIHGTVKDYPLTVQLTFSGDQLVLASTTIIDAPAFGISIPSFLAKDKLPGEMRIVAYKAAPGAAPAATPATTSTPEPTPTPGG